MLIRWLKDGGNVGIHGKLRLRHATIFELICLLKTRQTAREAVGMYLLCFFVKLRVSYMCRAKIEQRVSREKGIVVIFLESLCDDPAVIAANVALKVSSGDPDYKDMPSEVAKQDFLRRIKEYEAVYETITEPNLSYLRIRNVGDQVTLCHIHGYLQSRIAFYLMNLHLKPRSIFFSRVSLLSIMGIVTL